MVGHSMCLSPSLIREWVSFTAAGTFSEALPVPDPLAIGVVKAVGQPLGLQQLVAVRAQKQRFPASKMEKY